MIKFINVLSRTLHVAKVSVNPDNMVISSSSETDQVFFSLNEECTAKVRTKTGARSALYTEPSENDGCEKKSELMKYGKRLRLPSCKANALPANSVIYND